MATISFYLDVRRSNADGTFSLKLAVAHRCRVSYIALGVRLSPNQWNAEASRVTAGYANARSVNMWLSKVEVQAFEAVRDFELSLRGRSVTAKDYTDMVAVAIGVRSASSSVRFMDYLARYPRGKSAGTRSIYEQTARRIRAFDGGCDRLCFDDIDFEWLTRFEEFLARTQSKNARNVHLRNIRAVFNYAIDEEVTTCYPFRRFKIRPVPTRKRSLSLERVRQLWSYPVEEWQCRHRDMWFLSFFLCGINMVDLCRLTQITAEGRVEYTRAKTHRLYSIRVEPEALAIIERYRGCTHLLNILDVYGDYRDYLKRCNRSLQQIGTVERHGRGGRKSITPAFEGLTTYWARHTWATIAASLDIPRDTIAHALGHGCNTVTDIYIDFDQRKVDEANRRVIDWVLYGKR